MPRVKIDALLPEESATASPLRRSTRIAQAAPVPVAAPAGIATRRSSASEVVTATTPAKLTRSKRLSLTQENTTADTSEAALRKTRSASRSPTSLSKDPGTPRRTRAGSVSKSNEPSISTPSRRTRASSRAESLSPSTSEAKSTPLKTVRTRRSSVTDKEQTESKDEEAKEAPAKRTTRTRRSTANEPELSSNKDTEQDKNVTTEEDENASNKECNKEEKKVPKRRLSIIDTLTPLQAIEEQEDTVVESSSKSDQDIPFKKRKNNESTKEADLSVIVESEDESKTAAVNKESKSTDEVEETSPRQLRSTEKEKCTACSPKLNENESPRQLRSTEKAKCTACSPKLNENESPQITPKKLNFVVDANINEDIAMSPSLLNHSSNSTKDSEVRSVRKKSLSLRKSSDDVEDLNEDDQNEKVVSDDSFHLNLSSTILNSSESLSNGSPTLKKLNEKSGSPNENDMNKANNSLLKKSTLFSPKMNISFDSNKVETNKILCVNVVQEQLSTLMTIKDQLNKSAGKELEKDKTEYSFCEPMEVDETFVALNASVDLSKSNVLSEEMPESESATKSSEKDEDVSLKNKISEEPAKSKVSPIDTNKNSSEESIEDLEVSLKNVLEITCPSKNKKQNVDEEQKLVSCSNNEASMISSECINDSESVHQESSVSTENQNKLDESIEKLSEDVDKVKNTEDSVNMEDTSVKEVFESNGNKKGNDVSEMGNKSVDMIDKTNETEAVSTEENVDMLKSPDSKQTNKSPNKKSGIENVTNNGDCFADTSSSIEVIDDTNISPKAEENKLNNSLKKHTTKVYDQKEYLEEKCEEDGVIEDTNDCVNENISRKIDDCKEKANSKNVVDVLEDSNDCVGFENTSRKIDNCKEKVNSKNVDECIIEDSNDCVDDEDISRKIDNDTNKVHESPKPHNIQLDSSLKAKKQDVETANENVTDTNMSSMNESSCLEISDHSEKENITNPRDEDHESDEEENQNDSDDDNSSESSVSAKLEYLIKKKSKEDELDTDSSDEDFVLSQAEEGEEDTPSVGSNDIIDEGESIGSSCDLESMDSYDEDDSFIDDDEEVAMLEGFERIIKPADDSSDEEELVDASEKDKKSVDNTEPSAVNQPTLGFKRIIKPDDDSSDEEELVDALEKDKKTVDKTEPAENNSTVGQTTFDEIANLESLNVSRKRRSVSLSESLKVEDIKNESLVEQITHIVNTFCSNIKGDSGEVSLNLSVEYLDNDAVVKPNDADALPRSAKRRKVMIESDVKSPVLVENVDEEVEKIETMNESMTNRKTKKNKKRKLYTNEMDSSTTSSKKLKLSSDSVMIEDDLLNETNSNDDMSSTSINKKKKKNKTKKLNVDMANVVIEDNDDDASTDVNKKKKKNKTKKLNVDMTNDDKYNIEDNQNDNFASIKVNKKKNKHKNKKCNFDLELENDVGINEHKYKQSMEFQSSTPIHDQEINLEGHLEKPKLTKMKKNKNKAVNVDSLDENDAINDEPKLMNKKSKNTIEVYETVVTKKKKSKDAGKFKTLQEERQSEDEVVEYDDEIEKTVKKKKKNKSKKDETDTILLRNKKVVPRTGELFGIMPNTFEKFEIQEVTPTLRDSNSSWIIEDVNIIKPSRSNVKKIRKPVFHSKDFKNQMLFGSSSRIAREETRDMLRRKQKYNF